MDSEFGTTKLGGNPPPLETHKIPRTNWPPAELLNWPPPLGQIFFLLSEWCLCPHLFTFFFPTWQKFALFSLLTCPWNFSWVNQDTGGHPNAKGPGLGRSKASPPHPYSPVQKQWRNISTYKRIFAVNSGLCHAGSSLIQLFNLPLDCPVFLVLDLILCCFVCNRLIASEQWTIPCSLGV